MLKAKLIRTRSIPLLGMVIALSAGIAMPLEAGTWKWTAIYDFCSQGCRFAKYFAPGLLLYDAKGRIYGAVQGHRRGRIYEITRRGSEWKRRSLYAFCQQSDCQDGSAPLAGLIEDNSGNLYGLTYSGGTNDSGVFYELSPNSEGHEWTFHKLQDFDAGSNPCCLTYAGASTGARYDGVSPLYVSAIGPGAVYQLSNNEGSWISESIFELGRENGIVSVEDESGNLYGLTTLDGTSNAGTIFELKENSGHWSKIVLHNICSEPDCTDGAEPAGMTIDSTGNLYTAFSSGGPNQVGCYLEGEYSCGGVFKLVPNGAHSKYSLLYAFCSQPACADGYGPSGDLSLDASGNIFGTLAAGGAHGDGTVFGLHGKQYQTIYSFNTEFWPYGVVPDGRGNLFGTYESDTVYKLSP